jgi:hypothetical protein
VVDRFGQAVVGVPIILTDAWIVFGETDGDGVACGAATGSTVRVPWWNTVPTSAVPARGEPSTLLLDQACTLRLHLPAGGPRPESVRVRAGGWNRELLIADWPDTVTIPCSDVALQAEGAPPELEVRPAVLPMGTPEARLAFVTTPTVDVEVTGADGDPLVDARVNLRKRDAPPATFRIAADTHDCISAYAPGYLDARVCPESQGWPSPVVRVALTPAREVALLCVDARGEAPCPAGVWAECRALVGDAVGGCSLRSPSRCRCPNEDSEVVGTAPAPWGVFRAPVDGDVARVLPSTGGILVDTDAFDAPCGTLSLRQSTGREWQVVLARPECSGTTARWDALPDGEYFVLADVGRSIFSFGPIPVRAGELTSTRLALPALGASQSVRTPDLPPPRWVVLDCPGVRVLSPLVLAEVDTIDVPGGCRASVCGGEGGAEDTGAVGATVCPKHLEELLWPGG